MEAYTKLVIVAMVLVAMGTESMAINYSGLCGLSPTDLFSCAPAVRRLNPSAPTTACCAAVSKADLKCLCDYYKKNAKDLPSSIDPNLAMQLPTTCQLPQSTNIPCLNN